MKKSSLPFNLNINYNELDKNFGFAPIPKNYAPTKTLTKLENIIGKNSTFAFLDPTKKTKRWILTMKDSMMNGFLPKEFPTPVRCWWCHTLFSTHPLGCPLQLGTETKSETYYSHLNKKDITLTSSSSEPIYYLTKGYFCSWECLLAYGQSVKSSPEFHECIQYIYHMYTESGGIGTIQPAPHYTLRKEYGGPLSDEEYRTKHEKYSPTNNHYIPSVPIGELFDLSSKF